MEARFTRRDIGYSVISRFEEVFRFFLTEKLSILFNDFLEGIPLGIIEKSKERSQKNSFQDAYDLLEDTDFPDLVEIVCYHNMYETYFPDKSFNKSTFVSLMQDLYALRCKIAHINGYFTSINLDQLIEETKEVASHLIADGEDFLSFIKVLEQEPEKVVFPTPINFTDDLNISDIPNNIPTPDYEYEGGFVGREDDIKKLMSLVEGDLHRVITISGAGGVGKTALASRLI